MALCKHKSLKAGEKYDSGSFRARDISPAAPAQASAPPRIGARAAESARLVNHDCRKSAAPAPFTPSEKLFSNGTEAAATGPNPGLFGQQDG